jgi:hypothetical protein
MDAAVNGSDSINLRAVAAERRIAAVEFVPGAVAPALDSSHMGLSSA